MLRRFVCWLGRGVAAFFEDISLMFPGPEMPDWWVEDDPLLSDRQALNSDWAAVGDDMNEAMRTAEGESRDF